MDEDTANAVIMAARAHWFDDEAAPDGEVSVEADAVAEGGEAGHD
jgi:hypothetical protein